LAPEGAQKPGVSKLERETQIDIDENSSARFSVTSIP
jgi:hypothetical protein